jgi:excisionase family DNA binding protein
MKISDHFFTESQVASIFGVNRITIWRWIKEGKFDTQKIGQEVLIPKWQVELIKEDKAKRERTRL